MSLNPPCQDDDPIDELRERRYNVFKHEYMLGRGNEQVSANDIYVQFLLAFGYME